ncbi:TIGR04222 domain-containing membrane protein [Streptomyces sp. NPDC051561]|uniref:TIGR04222 domain-containing membrane protein n=1 Tax=Streptomyces sp. NPDC051561 TaxID=3365658 RepID=UPI00378D78CB
MFWVLFLLVSWVAVIAACARLCLAAQACADTLADVPFTEDALTLPEAAFLSGGPGRVADLTLLTLHTRRRLMLAHTGWTTVVAPHGEDALERAVIGAAGPGGQSRTAEVRRAVAEADAVRVLAERLVASGLAVPANSRRALSAGVRAVRGATLLTLVLGVVSVLVLPQDPEERDAAALWFSLPLVLTLGALAIARVEVHPYTRWASLSGQQLLRALSRGPDPDAGPEQALLAAVAVRGVRAIPDPQLRSALAGPRGRQPLAHRGQ